MKKMTINKKEIVLYRRKSDIKNGCWNEVITKYGVFICSIFFFLARGYDSQLAL